MLDFVKVILPLVAVAMASIIAFFISDHIGEIRSSPSIVYDLQETKDSVSLTLTNVGGSRIVGAKVVLTCEVGVSACFVQDQGGYHKNTAMGPVDAQDITKGLGYGDTQVALDIALMPDARLNILAQKADGLTQPISFKFESRSEQPVRLIEEKGVTGIIVRNYLDVLVFGFQVALGVLVALVVLGVVGLAWALWRLVFRRFQKKTPLPAPLPSNIKMEIDDETLVLHILLRPAGAAAGGGGCAANVRGDLSKGHGELQPRPTQDSGI